MSGKCRLMSAGNSCSSLYNLCTPSNEFGGNKKQDLPSKIGLGRYANRERNVKANGIGKQKFFCMNQLGGIGRGHSIFGGNYIRADGLKCTPKLSLG